MKTYYLFLCILANIALTDAQTFTATFGTDIPIDDTAIEFELSVSGLPSVIDTLTFGLETVCLNIQEASGINKHIRLVAPDGSSCLLLSNDGYTSNLSNTCFDQSADEYIYNASYPWSGTWKPEGDMGCLNNGQDPNGTWKLIVYAINDYDPGIMEEWSITFGNNPAIRFPFHAADLPIIKINTGGHWILNDTKTVADFYLIDNEPGELNYADDTDYYYAGKVSIELQGHSSLRFSKKSYDIDLLDDAGNEIDTVLLGLPSENDFIIRADYAEPLFMKSEMAYEMIRRSGNYAPRTRYCELILDGEYEGLYSFQEKPERDENRMDVAKLNNWDTSGVELTGGYLFKSNYDFYHHVPADFTSSYISIPCGTAMTFSMIYPNSDSIQPQQLNYIQAYVDSFEDALYSPDFLDTIAGYRKFASARSFVDIMLINELMGNWEGYVRNIYFTKEKITDGGQLKIGPQTDFDDTGSDYWKHDWMYKEIWICPMPFWWDKLVTDPEFLMERYCRYNFLRDSIWTSSFFDHWIDSVRTLTADAVQRNYARWTKQEDVVYEASLGSFIDYLQFRLEWLQDTLNYDSIGAPESGFSFAEIAPAYVKFTPLQTHAEYAWDFGDGTTSTEQSPEHIYTESGSYTVTLNVNYHYGCSDRHAETLTVVVSGIQDIHADNIKIYPNPADDLLFAECGSNTDITPVISDITGNKYAIVYDVSEGRMKINVASLTPGIYFLSMYDNSSSYTEKIIIQ